MNTPIQVRKPTGRRCKELLDPPNRMREIRLQKGYTLREFARLLGVKAPSLSEHETTGSGIGSEKIYLASDILKTDPRVLDRKPEKKLKAG